MRLREIFYLLGFKPRFRFFGYRIQAIDLPKDGTVHFARWLAPNGRDLVLHQSEIDELRTFISEGDFAIDIGAHTGDTALPIAIACGAGGAVLAFEPNPASFAVLGANAAMNPLITNIIPVPFAAAEADGPRTFDYGDPWLNNGGDHTGISRWRHGSAFSIPVEGRRVEPLIRQKYRDRLQRLRYIKTDVEGYDLAVLRSLRGLIAEFRPYVKAEVGQYSSPDDRKEMLRFFSDLHYELRLVQPHTLFGPEAREADLLNSRTLDIFAIPG